MAVKLRKSLSDKMMFYMAKKKMNDDENESKKMNMMSRCLITVNVLGSSGPLRFVANEKDSVYQVIKTALKLYGREKRFPLLGNKVDHFFLYPAANAGFDALSPSVPIGSQGRTFVLCKKEKQPQMTQARSEMVSRRKGNSFKAWINNSLTFKHICSKDDPSGLYFAKMCGHIGKS